VAHGVKGQTAGYGAGVYGDGQASGIGLWGDSISRVGIFGTCTTGIGIFGVSKATAPNQTVAPPLIAGVSGQGFARIGVYGLSDNASGVYGTSTSGVGVLGSSASSLGIFGVSTASAGSNSFPLPTQIAGVAGQGVGRIGVHGLSDSAAGVSGTSTSAAGVFGTSTSAFGVQGASQNAYGVSGNSTTQAGVWGSSNNNVGVLGSSTSGVGVNGVSVSSNGVNALSTSGIGIYAASPSGQAGRFDGDVVIIGNLTVSGNFPHSSAVPSSDGTLRRLFSPGMAEAYYEDLGQGSLTNGVGAVTLDPAFAALVRTDAYQVFLTAYGDNRGLYVSNQTVSGFEVREVQGGTSSIGFGYRVVARPRDLPTSRLDRVTLPPSPPQPKLDRVEPLDVPATLREMHHNDGPVVTAPAGQPSRQQDGR
jgi:hypothetical protein